MKTGLDAVGLHFQATESGLERLVFPCKLDF